MSPASHGTKAAPRRLASGQIDALLKQNLSHYRGPAREMYAMLEYFLGFRDEHLRPAQENSGKRFRAILALTIADMYGVYDETVDAALAVELFHNFTLIHDDIEDGDAMRRGRQTLWKLFGVNHAMNAGDALMILVGELCARIASSPNGSELSQALLRAFRITIEGQYLDFKLSSQSLDMPISEKQYLQMIAYKTGALVGVSAEIGAILASKKSDSLHLRRFGELVGITYQLVDDYRSFWNDDAATGKDAYGDIRERKRTLPFLLALSATDHASELKHLYGLDRPLRAQEINRVRDIVHDTPARTAMLAKIRARTTKITATLNKLSLPQKSRAILIDIVDALMPETHIMSI